MYPTRPVGNADGARHPPAASRSSDSCAVTLIQRFGSAANLNIHLHCLVLDGVYRRGTDGVPVFVEVPAPTDDELQAVLHKIITRTMKMLTRRAVLVEEQGQTYMADNDSDSDEARAQAAASRGVYLLIASPLAHGPTQKVLTVHGTMPRRWAFNQPRCADMQGFSLHAAVRWGAEDRQALEQLCRGATLKVTHQGIACQLQFARLYHLDYWTWGDDSEYPLRPP